MEHFAVSKIVYLHQNLLICIPRHLSFRDHQRDVDKKRKKRCSYEQRKNVKRIAWKQLNLDHMMNCHF